RAGGGDAVNDVLGAPRALAEMLWARETEGHAFDTPERRAALEARVNEVTAAIADEAVRRYYRQGFSARLAQVFAPPAQQRGPRDAHWPEPPGGGHSPGGPHKHAPGAARPAAGAGRHARGAGGREGRGEWRRRHDGATARGAHITGGAQPPLAAARSP